MIGIAEIAVSIPENSIDNIAQAKGFGADDNFAVNRIGAATLPVMGEGEDTSDLAVRAVNALIEKSGIDRESVEFLVICTQNPDACGLPHTSAIVQQKAGLSTNIAAFDISLGCSGYVYGLHTAKGFMESAGLKCGIFVTADPYSKIINREDKNTSLLFGDAATATLLSADPVLEIGPARFSTDGSGGENIINRDGMLDMNGRQVFNFAILQVPAQIEGLLAKSETALSSIDLFVLHQGSKVIVETLTKRMKLPVDKVPVALHKTGNTVSSSIPLILADYVHREEMKKFLLSGFGVGLSWGSTLLKRME